MVASRRGALAFGPVPQYQFLSDEWLRETRKIREEFRQRVPEIPVSVRMNQVVHEVPFGEGTIRAYVDTSSGRLEMDTGELDSPDLTVTLSYSTAKAILVDGDAQAAMNAFLSGRIKVDGDITKMIALQTAGAGTGMPPPNANPAAVEMVERIRSITL